jgi:hypothetical protein
MTMNHGLKNLALSATAVALLTASIVGTTKLPASSSISPDKTCHLSTPCLSWTNTGTGNGISGVTTASNGRNGVEGDASSSVASGVFGDNNNGYIGVAGRTEGTAVAYGAGVQGSSYNSNAAFLGIVNTRDTGAPIFIGDNQIAQAFLVDDYGNIHITGQIYTSGSCHSGCSMTHHVVSPYVRTSQPTMEDVGEATLRNGSAHVGLDPAFANVIDGRKPFVVLLTPEGDAGIYVANRTPNGFDVRAVAGGRATIAFAYRIVAKPYGVSDARLPFRDDRLPGRLPKMPAR